jgi:intracellular sulfur oxidation DsrE/DsrF family protein
MSHSKTAAYPLFCLLLSLVSVSAPAAGPWGSARVTATDYKPQKVVYDVSVDTERELTHVIDRASYLSKLTGADPFDSSIVLVLHGPEIRFFAIENFEANKELITRAQSLTVGGTVKIRMCKIAAEGQGFAPEDLHGFVELVPMGDAEIVRLQNEEAHAYMR